MKFLHLFNKSSSAYDGFAKIQGYEDIKDLVRRVLDSEENYNCYRATILGRVKVLPKLGSSPARYIGAGVWKNGRCRKGRGFIVSGSSQLCSGVGAISNKFYEISGFSESDTGVRGGSLKE